MPGLDRGEEKTMRFAILGICLVCASACARDMSQTGSSAGDVDLTPNPPTSAPAVSRIPAMEQETAYHDASVSTAARIALLQAEVASIDARVPDGRTDMDFPLTRSEAVLPADAFADITHDRWAEMYSYSDGQALRRIRMRPARGEATEEFYYDGGKLIAVHFEAHGDVKPEPHPEAGGEMFYFGADGLLAWVREDGTLADPSSAPFKHWAAQLPKEAARFPLGQ
jgi:hypothetical protein